MCFVSHPECVRCGVTCSVTLWGLERIEKTIVRVIITMPVGMHTVHNKIASQDCNYVKHDISIKYMVLRNVYFIVIHVHHRNAL